MWQGEGGVTDMAFDSSGFGPNRVQVHLMASLSDMLC